ncbi:MAG: hypothetical protein N4A39_08490 [Roseicyclus sp.]|nr:hypothetical protein [Roseicyclus sp.]
MPDDWAAFRNIRLAMRARDWFARMRLRALMLGTRAQGCAAFHHPPRHPPGQGHRPLPPRPEARGQGHMPRLLAALADDARGLGILQPDLQVATWTAPALAAYARAGFERVATIPRAMRDAEGFADKGALRPAS